MSIHLFAVACILGACYGRRVKTQQNTAPQAAVNDPLNALATALLLSRQKVAAFVSPALGGPRQRVGRHGPSTMAERRLDPDEGVAYTQAEFEDFYGADAWQAKWDAAEPAPDVKGIEDFTVGEEVEAKVVSVASFGAFCDIGANQNALLHISQISDEFITDINEKVQEGQTLKAKISQIDIEQGRIGLSCKEGGGSARPPVDPNATPLTALSVGQEVEGTVQSVASFGAFVDFGAQKPGMVHISELGDGFVEDINDKISVGQAVKAKIKEVDVERGRIALTMNLE